MTDKKIELQFDKRFCWYVRKGIKRQTMRSTTDCQVGDTLRLFDENGDHLLGEATVEAVRPVHLTARAIRIGLDRVSVDGFAMSEGFDTFPEMVAWFRDRYGMPFDGVLIQWGKIK